MKYEIKIPVFTDIQKNIDQFSTLPGKTIFNIKLIKNYAFTRN